MVENPERPCVDCVLSPEPFGSAYIERQRYKTSDPEDLDAISNHPEAKAILAALALDRPDRCRQLAGLFPPPENDPAEYRLHSLCAEINLANVILNEDDFADGKYDTPR